MMGFVSDRKENIMKQGGHDGPGVAHLSFPDYEV